QHILGRSCGADLVYIAYCDHARLPAPPPPAKPFTARKWIAEDAFTMEALRLLWARDPKIHAMFRLARGRKIGAIWSVKDPLPLIALFVTRLIPNLINTLLKRVWSAVTRLRLRKRDTSKVRVYEEHLHKQKSVT